MKTRYFLSVLLIAAIAFTACQPMLESTMREADQQAIEQESTEMENSQTDKVAADAEPPQGADSEFSTDFSISSVNFDSILSGGPPKDGIPSLDNPEFVSVDDADEWLEPNEPVIQLEVNGEAKAYPLQILMWHEIANDAIGGVPVVVTFCPLCNTAIVFERNIEGQVLDFGTTGRLRYSNLIMYDRQTESWWQQAEGNAIIGELTGSQLEFLPAAIVSWEQFSKTYPDGLVLSRDTGFSRAYGRNPYTGYDDVNNPPFLYFGPETPGTLPAVARVLAVDIDGEAVAYPYNVLEEIVVVNDSVGESDVVVFWTSGTSSALDAQIISEGRDVGAAAIFNRKLNGEMLTFSLEDGRIVDDQTGSTWDILGRAVEGQLAGQQLEQLVSVNHFWFSWAAFKPETRVYQP